jgi:hypothetical protein
MANTALETIFMITGSFRNNTTFIVTGGYVKAGTVSLKVHKIENFFEYDFGICVISLLGMSKY